jgi:hypothetical protein
MSPQPPDLPPDGPGPDAGLEWLFKKGGQVYGPVSTPKLLQMLYRGEIDGGTMVSGDDGAFQALGSIPAFVVHAKKAEAQVRVEREVTGARALERRRRLRRTALAVALGLAALGGGGYGAWWLATHKPWLGRSALLEDFGNGIAIASPARVGGGRHRAGGEEVEIPAEGPAAARRAAPPRPQAAAGGATGDLVATQYDAASIQAVVGREQRTLAPCFRAEAQRSPGFAGEIPIEFVIGNDGRVAQLWVDEPRFKRGELYDCLLRTLKGWSFRPFPGARPAVALSFRVGPR